MISTTVGSAILERKSDACVRRVCNTRAVATKTTKTTKTTTTTTTTKQNLQLSASSLAAVEEMEAAHDRLPMHPA